MKKSIMFLIGGLVTCVHISAQSNIFIKDGKAINGYDAVAYFTESKPVQGKDELVYSWNNARWYFSSQQNLDSFKVVPEKYAPQYGGYCAYGLSEGHKAPTSPIAWTIVDGKLYLNYNSDVLKLWSKDRLERIEKADKNWPEIKDKKSL
ncbi:MAG: YHS domain-containing (seleno)protein [Ferruginibacter sp.]